MKYKSKNIKPSSVPANLIKEKGNGIKIKVYIKDQMIGTGKMELFLLVHQKGSVKSAAKIMGMSYKRANFLLNTLEKVFPKPILEKQKGNKGTILTPFGIELLERFFKLNDHLSEEANVFIQWVTSKQV
ncbi:MAG: LysR family transcriptional regulator [Alphaproteobacteria bacterium TMED194]|nr:MAG: LysR family transcriptional regulator [Alphaproteobacteria bacterium TMED194]|tara:strand:+ start:6993 stop:7379 length:387 start_codon:yes stop_codon:yes gene_type:complete